MGLIAGGGAMPVEIIDHCNKNGIPVFAVGLKPFADEEQFGGAPHILAGIGQAGKILNAFKEHDVHDIVLAGGIKRPSLKELIPDMEAIKILAKLPSKTAL